MPGTPQRIAVDPAHVTLVYRDEENHRHTQPLADVIGVGTLIDPQTGADMEIIEAMIDLPDTHRSEAATLALASQNTPAFVDVDAECILTRLRHAGYGAITTALVPAHTILVSFEAVSQTESDPEHSYSVDYTDLTNPRVLAHALSDVDLVGLGFAIEAVGGLQDSDGYDRLDAAIADLAAEPVRRDRAGANDPEFCGLSLDHPPRAGQEAAR